MNNAEKNTQNTEIVILATAKAIPGKVTTLREALMEVATPTRAQKGCIRFDLFQSAQDPHAIIALEHWASKEDHEKHLQGEHVKTLMSRFDGVLAAPPEFLPMLPL